MADIDQILAGIGGNTRADFKGSGDIVGQYFKGRDEYAKNDLRDAFKDGVPTNPDGSIDFATMAKTLYQKGGIDQGNAIASSAIGPTERAKLDAVDSPPASSAIVSPPSTNRQASTPVAPSLAKGGETPQSQPGQMTPAAFLDGKGLAGYPKEVALAFFKRNGIEPDQPFNPDDPAIAAKLGSVLPRIQSIGQVQPPQPGDNPPQQVAQAQPVPQSAPLQASPAQEAAQNDPILKRLTLLSGSPDKATAEAARIRLKSYLASKESTPEMKNATASGMTLPQYQEKQGELAAEQAGATERAKSYVAKYDAINEAGDKAINEIPKLHLALKQMDDPNYYSGPFNQYNLNAKRLVAALGGDPDKAAPQEIVNKITADSVLNGMGALKGLGPIRVAEMKLLSQASMSPDNSVQAQKFLASMAIRVQERVAQVSDVAQNYNEGVLDNGFDKKIRAMDRAEPLFTQPEIDRFQKILQGKEKQQAAPAGQRFASPSDVQAAVASGKLKSGDAFLTSDGRTKYVP